MCYTVSGLLYAQIKRARRYVGDNDELRKLEELYKELTGEPFFQANGFDHPHLLIYTEENPHIPVAAQWGLIPHWVKDEKTAKQIWNKTINARGESIFEKPSFRSAAKSKRCLIQINGFYEYHHYKGKTYPFYIYRKDGEAITLGGIWSEWVNKESGEIFRTFSIVTTEGNELLAKIHNNPKLSGPRMPLIIPEEKEEEWLKSANNEMDKEEIKQLILPYASDELQAHTVAKLKGKNAVGNVPEATDKVVYEELEELKLEF